MIEIKFKLWNKDNSEEDIERVVPFVPEAGDTVFFKDKDYKVSCRGIDLNTGKYTKIHCNEI